MIAKEDIKKGDRCVIALSYCGSEVVYVTKCPGFIAGEDIPFLSLAHMVNGKLYCNPCYNDNYYGGEQYMISKKEATEYLELRRNAEFTKGNWKVVEIIDLCLEHLTRSEFDHIYEFKLQEIITEINDLKIKTNRAFDENIRAIYGLLNELKDESK